MTFRLRSSILTAALFLAHDIHARASSAVTMGACYAAAAATRNDTLGMPQQAEVTPDGRTVVYLRSGPRDTRLGFFAYDIASRVERELAAPEQAEHLSTEEKARRERARMTLSGITDYEMSQDGTAALVSQGDRLAMVSLADGRSRPVPGTGWIAPHLSPDGRFVAAVRDDDLHVVELGTGADLQLTRGGTETLTHGLPEFVASEELDREDGAWWSPDSRTLLYEESDTSGVQPHWIADPAHPERMPTEFRYPRAGTANARVRLGLVSRSGGRTRWVDWDSAAFPYLVRVVWPRGGGRLTLVVQNRAETEQRLIVVEPATGHATTLLRETDPAWVLTSPGLNWHSSPLPRWLPDGSGFFWATDRTGPWRLELHRADGTLDHVLTPPDLSFLSLDDVDVPRGTVTVLAAPNSMGSAVYRLPIHGGAPLAIAAEPGEHAARFTDGNHGLFVDAMQGADGRAATVVRRADDGRITATLPDHAEAAPPVRVEYTEVGPDRFDASIQRPLQMTSGHRYPVILSVYGGPGVKVVTRTPRRLVENQCLADSGFIVVSLDGRGTPGRGHDWERAIKGDLVDRPLEDQVSGLRALADRYPEMDLSRVGITGWSFGGTMTAMATIRRPDVFRVGVAGAPLVDAAEYDTAYTERYLGTPQADPDGYRKSNVLTYAAALSRPLMIIHGQTDDNVYFANTVELTRALLEAGKPYDLLLLPGTHLLSDPTLRARVDEARTEFLLAHLGTGAD